MIKKSISYNSLNGIDECVSHRKMVKTKSYDSVQHMLSDDSKMTPIHKIEHVGALLAYAPINNVFKCVSERTFPVSILSDSDDTNIDMGVCLMDSEKYIPKGVERGEEEEEEEIINVLKNNIEKLSRSCRRRKIKK